jgi:hypothetical protein
MLKFIHAWLGSLDTTEQDLQSQGYMIVYAGVTSFVVPIGLVPNQTRKQRPTPVTRTIGKGGAETWTPVAFRSSPA